MNCEHCGSSAPHTYGGVPLCSKHAAYYFPNTTPDDPDSLAFMEAARSLGYAVKKLDPREYSYDHGITVLLVTCPYPSVIREAGLTFEYGEVRALLIRPFGENSNMRVTVEPNPKSGNIHPHVSYVSSGVYKLCLDSWYSAIQLALFNKEWHRALMLIYESACHYNALGTYHHLALPCQLCGVVNHHFCVNCGRATCRAHLNSRGHCMVCCPPCPACGRAGVTKTCPCGAVVCDECAEYCHECGNPLCADHRVTCQRCHRVWCPTCLPKNKQEECRYCEQKRKEAFFALLERMDTARRTVRDSRSIFSQRIAWYIRDNPGAAEDSYRSVIVEPSHVGF
jgi:hypothetical protein